MKLNKKILLLIVLIFAFLVRTFALNWDQNNHFHPDERAIIMTVEKISWPDNWNPKFFAYGSLPFYLLKITSLNLAHIFPPASSYDYLSLIGRFISAMFDTLTVYIIYLTCLLFPKGRKFALLASFLYATCVLPVQLSHFYAVDTLLTCFIYLSLYFSLKFYFDNKSRNIIFSGIFTGFAFATKISAFPILVPIFLILLIKKNKILNMFYFGIFALCTFFIAMPYAFLDFKTFYRQIMDQQAMTKNAYVFPYTLQYVKTLAYIYPLKNIFLWGVGPFLSLAFLLSFKKFNKIVKIKGLIFPLLFCFIYFAIVGRFAVKFMRYMLPIYPLICIIASIYLVSVKKYISLFIMLHLFCLIAFMNIYLFPNTRITASAWMRENIPPRTKILTEHWDDGLPVGYASDFINEQLSLYDSDQDPQKWIKINKQLKESEYIIIASNRLWKPLTTLKEKYPITSKYYQDLFAGKLGFQKVKEFTVSPNIFGLNISDQSADESFTVYDHPQILIFKKI